mmetsp:Transcript_73164/g.163780  ORF Transcript_73164/g.163780 Transcript_73164/m.163780 type:complete len:340 (-) Transcript_73164:180-1199(-)
MDKRRRRVAALEHVPALPPEQQHGEESQSQEQEQAHHEVGPQEVVLVDVHDLQSGEADLYPRARGIPQCAGLQRASVALLEQIVELGDAQQTQAVVEGAQILDPLQEDWNLADGQQHPTDTELQRLGDDGQRRGLRPRRRHSAQAVHQRGGCASKNQHLQGQPEEVPAEAHKPIRAEQHGDAHQVDQGHFYQRLGEDVRQDLVVPTGPLSKEHGRLAHDDFCGPSVRRKHHVDREYAQHGHVHQEVPLARARVVVVAVADVILLPGLAVEEDAVHYRHQNVADEGLKDDELPRSLVAADVPHDQRRKFRAASLRVLVQDDVFPLVLLAARVVLAAAAGR